MRLSIMPRKLIAQGFSLVEMAIVLVIVGLLIGGILRGQELITSGRVSNLIAQQQAIQTAYYAFQDRYKMMPGDLTAAQAATINASTSQAWNNPGDGWADPTDGPQFFNNLAQAGFLACAGCMQQATVAPTGSALFCNINNCPVNVFGLPVAFAYPIPTSMPATNTTGTFYLSTLAAEGSKAMASTGAGVTAGILSEMDRKIDDANPASGQFRFTNYSSTGSTSVETSMWQTCVTPSTTGGTSYSWVANSSGAVCQGVLLL